MKSFEIFIFGLVNFALLIGFLLWGLRKTARQFLYARRANIKKEMTQSAHQLRDAKLRLAKAKRSVENLQADIEERRRSIAKVADKECNGIIEEAKRHAGLLIAGAMRQGERERARAMAEVRTSILENAFARASKTLKEILKGETGRKAALNSLAEFSSLIKQKMDGHEGIA